MRTPYTLAFLLISTAIHAQTDTTQAVVTDTSQSVSTLTMGATYSNNVSYYGQKAAAPTPFTALSLTYKLRSGIYFSALGYQLLNEKPANGLVYAAGIGGAFKLSKRWSLDMNYTHSFFPALSPLLQASNDNNASLSISWEKWLTVTATGDYAFGKTNDIFSTLAISKQIDLFSVTSKDIITLTPSLDVVAGTQRYYQSYVKEQKLRDSVLGTIISPIFGPPSSPETTTVVAESFNLLSYSLKLPLAYNRNHYVIEAAYQLSRLSDYAQIDAGKFNSFLNFSFYYQF